MTPAFSIAADGTDLTARVAGRLERLTLTDQAGFQSDSLEITLDDRGGGLAIPRQGAELALALGYAETGLTDMGLFTVDEVEVAGWPALMTIRARAADMRASLKASKTRSWDATTLGALTEAIAGEHGLIPAVAPALAGRQVAHMDQTNESDLHLMARLARQADAVAKPVAGRLVLVPKGEAKSATGRAMPAVALTARDLRDYRVTIQDRDRYGAVEAVWMDQRRGYPVVERVGSGDGGGGGSGGPGPVVRLRHPHASAAEARAAAEGRRAALERGRATLSLSCAGTPALAAEARLTLSGVRAGVDGEWVITQATHTLDGAGYLTEIEAEVPKGA